jgi:hypothetical protein
MPTEDQTGAPPDDTRALCRNIRAELARLPTTDDAIRMVAAAVCVGVVAVLAWAIVAAVLLVR